MFGMFVEEPYNGMDAMWALDCLLKLYLKVNNIQKS